MTQKQDNEINNGGNPTIDTGDIQLLDADSALGEMPIPTVGAQKPTADDIPEPKQKKRRTSSPRTAKQSASTAAASAEMVTGGLDMMRKAIGGIDPEKRDPARKACVDAWEHYFLETGKEPPAWAVVMVVSTMYVAPALTTESGSSFLGGLADKWRGWRAMRKSKSERS